MGCPEEVGSQDEQVVGAFCRGPDLRQLPLAAADPLGAGGVEPFPQPDEQLESKTASSTSSAQPLVSPGSNTMRTAGLAGIGAAAVQPEDVAGDRLVQDPMSAVTKQVERGAGE